MDEQAPRPFEAYGKALDEAERETGVRTLFRVAKPPIAKPIEIRPVTPPSPQDAPIEQQPPQQ